MSAERENEMSEYTKRAAELFRQGFNCSQSVFAAFCDEFGMDEKTALRVSAGLGGGVGRLREVCGALTGAAMAVGIKFGATEAGDVRAKAETYEKVQEIAAELKKKHSSVICRELLGLPAGEPAQPKPSERGPAFYANRPCARLVEDAAAAAEKILFAGRGRNKRK